MTRSNFIFAFGILFLGFLLQTYAIWPIELLFRQDALVDIVSVVFVPHGIKVLVFMMFGVAVLPATFLAQLINGYLLFGTIDFTGVISALAGSICIAIPIMLHNLSLGRKLAAAPLFNATTTLNMFWTFLSVACVASLFNGMMHTAIFGFPDNGLPFLYLVGDVTGSLIVCMLLLMFTKVIISQIPNLGVKND